MQKLLVCFDVIHYSYQIGTELSGVFMHLRVQWLISQLTKIWLN